MRQQDIFIALRCAVALRRDHNLSITFAVPTNAHETDTALGNPCVQISSTVVFRHVIGILLSK